MSPAIIQQGDDEVIALGDLTYLLHSVVPLPEGFRVSLTVMRGAETLGRDTVPLWSSRRRKEFAGGFANGMAERVEQDLLTIEGALKEVTQERRRREAEELANAEAAEAMTKAERGEALELLLAGRLLLRVQHDLTTMGIIGEDRVKVITYLSATARRQPIGQGLAVTFKAGSSSGKNHIARGVADLMPPEDVLEFTNLSPKALFYMGENGVAHKLVICTEVAGREEAEYAVRTLISEPFISSAIPVKDEETGRFATETFRVNGPIAYVETTTNSRLNVENQTRVFELYLNEEEGQTRAIIRQQAREAGPERFKIESERERIRRVHRNAQRLLQSDLHVIIPYAERLTFPSKDRRARRDFPKLLNLIRVIAFLHQYQREIREDGGRRFIEAVPTDYALAYALAVPTFEQTLDPLDHRDRKLLDTILSQVTAQASRDGVDLGAVQFDRGDVSRWTGRHRNHLVSPLNRLEDGDYLERVQGSIGRKIIYTINQQVVAADEGFGGLLSPEEL